MNSSDLIFCAKTIYYVSPEIDIVLKNIDAYLKNNGLFVFTYNQRDDSFSNKFLTYELLRIKILSYGKFEEIHFIEMNRFSSEKKIIGMYRKI